MAKNAKAKTVVVKTNKKKDNTQTAGLGREQIESLNDLKELRRRGVLTRQMFRLICWEKGLSHAIKGVPEITSYEFVQDKVVGRRLVVSHGQWAPRR